MSGINAFFWVLAVGVSVCAVVYVFVALASLYDEWKSALVKADARRHMDWLAKHSTRVNGEWVTRFVPQKRYFGDYDYASDVATAALAAERTP